MTIWRGVCFFLGHTWKYKNGYRICVECDKIERLP